MRRRDTRVWCSAGGESARAALEGEDGAYLVRRGARGELPIQTGEDKTEYQVVSEAANKAENGFGQCPEANTTTFNPLTRTNRRRPKPHAPLLLKPALR